MSPQKRLENWLALKTVARDASLPEGQGYKSKDFGSHANYLGSQLRTIQNIFNLAASNAKYLRQTC
jgi:hypothetical protein